MDHRSLVAALVELSAAPDLDAAVAIVRERTRALVGADGVTFVLREGDRVFYRDEAAIGPLWKGQRFLASQCISGWAILNRKAAILPDITVDPRIPQDAYRPTFVQSLLMVPIRSADPLGAIGVYWSKTHEATPEEVEVVQALADAVSLAVQNTELGAERRRQLEERERLESAMRAAEKARLENTVERLSDLVKIAPAFVGFLDRDGVVLTTNDLALEAIEARAADVEGRPVWETPWWAGRPESAARVREAVALAVQGKASQLDLEYWASKDGAGSVRWLALAVTPMTDAAGNVTRIAATGIDITERLEAQRALREADRRKDEFLAMLSHELRNPLAPIATAVELLKLRVGNAPGAERPLGIIARQTQHLTRLVDDLLEVSRITRGKIRLEREPLEVSVAVNRAIEVAKPHLDAKKHDLSISLPPEPLWVHADPVRLAQVLGNLLDNAAKYTDERGEISLSVAAEESKIVFRIRDNGIGIPAELLPRIFEPFTQADTSLDRAQGGLGVGLTLVRALVELHGGTVEARSDGPRRGSELVVRLPALTAAAASDAARGAGRSASAVGS